MLKPATWICIISCNYKTIPCYNWMGQWLGNHRLNTVVSESAVTRSETWRWKHQASHKPQEHNLGLPNSTTKTKSDTPETDAQGIKHCANCSATAFCSSGLRVHPSIRQWQKTRLTSTKQFIYLYLLSPGKWTAIIYILVVSTIIINYFLLPFKPCCWVSVSLFSFFVLTVIPFFYKNAFCLDWLTVVQSWIFVML